MRINVGSQASVTASEKWLTYIQAGQAFALGLINPGLAGNFSPVQLFNPVASGKTVLVRRVVASVGVTTQMILGIYNTALTTDQGAGLNLLVGGAASVAHVRSVQQVGNVGASITTLDLNSGNPQYLGPDWLCQLPAGTGIVVTSGVVAVEVGAGFYWAEF